MPGLAGGALIELKVVLDVIRSESIERCVAALVPGGAEHFRVEVLQAGIVDDDGDHLTPKPLHFVFPSFDFSGSRQFGVFDFEEVGDGIGAFRGPDTLFGSAHAFDLLDDILPIDGGKVAVAKGFGLLDGPGVWITVIELGRFALLLSERR